MSLSRTLAISLVTKKSSLNDIIELLTKYKLLVLLPSIKQDLIQISSSVHKKDTVIIESPFKLSPPVVEKIKGMVGDIGAPYEVVINKNILAGFKAKFKGIMYDGSAERIIKQLLH